MSDLGLEILCSRVVAKAWTICWSSKQGFITHKRLLPWLIPIISQTPSIIMGIAQAINGITLRLLVLIVTDLLQFCVDQTFNLTVSRGDGRERKKAEIYSIVSHRDSHCNTAACQNLLSCYQESEQNELHSRCVQSHCRWPQWWENKYTDVFSNQHKINRVIWKLSSGQSAALNHVFPFISKYNVGKKKAKSSIFYSKRKLLLQRRADMQPMKGCSIFLTVINSVLLLRHFYFI